MPNIGFPELVVILVIALLVFGAGRLPHVGNALGKSIREFKRGMGGEDEQPTPPAAATKAEPPPAEAAQLPAKAQATPKNGA